MHLFIEDALLKAFISGSFKIQDLSLAQVCEIYEKGCSCVDHEKIILMDASYGVLAVSFRVAF